jgi:hypothetical protein
MDKLDRSNFVSPSHEEILDEQKAKLKPNIRSSKNVASV